MKLILACIFLMLPIAAQAADINLRPGESVEIGSNVITCGAAEAPLPGGCNPYGCWRNGGGCNEWGCWHSPYGGCNSHGCSDNGYCNYYGCP